MQLFVIYDLQYPKRRLSLQNDEKTFDRNITCNDIFLWRIPGKG